MQTNVVNKRSSTLNGSSSIIYATKRRKKISRINKTENTSTADANELIYKPLEKNAMAQAAAQLMAFSGVSTLTDFEHLAFEQKQQSQFYAELMSQCNREDPNMLIDPNSFCYYDANKMSANNENWDTHQQRYVNDIKNSMTNNSSATPTEYNNYAATMAVAAATMPHNLNMLNHLDVVNNLFNNAAICLDTHGTKRRFESSSTPETNSKALVPNGTNNTSNTNGNVKSNPSKRHRERLNAELEHLANLLPFDRSVITKLDKLSILRLAVCNLRVKSFFHVALNRPPISTRALIVHTNNVQKVLTNTESGEDRTNLNKISSSGIIYEDSYAYQNRSSRAINPPIMTTLDIDEEKCSSTKAEEIPRKGVVYKMESLLAKSHHEQMHKELFQSNQFYDESIAVLEALNGFLFITTVDGEIFYSSKTVENFLGFHQSDIVHQSIFELIHSEDREEFRRQLHPPENKDIPQYFSSNANTFFSNPLNTNNNHSSPNTTTKKNKNNKRKTEKINKCSTNGMSKKMKLSSPDNELPLNQTQEMNKEEGNVMQISSKNIKSNNLDASLNRSFTVRFRCLLDNTSGFVTLDVTGRLGPIVGQNLQQPQKAKWGLFALACPFGPPSLFDISYRDVFKSKHTMCLQFLSIDQKGKYLLGYSFDELLSTTTYNLLHPCDLKYYADAHDELIKTGTSGLVSYRMQTANFQWQWLQTSMRVMYKNNKPEFIIANHRPLSSEEGIELFFKRGSEFKLPYPCLYDFDLHSFDNLLMSNNDLEKLSHYNSYYTNAVAVMNDVEKYQNKRIKSEKSLSNFFMNPSTDYLQFPLEMLGNNISTCNSDISSSSGYSSTSHGYASSDSLFLYNSPELLSNLHPNQ
ncbi:hypothetical protein SNEBB_011259 [Seison nebaliae]|nr:hypothetical protein SNEBB_011259 [Seison nebaliae]